MSLSGDRCRNAAGLVPLEASSRGARPPATAYGYSGNADNFLASLNHVLIADEAHSAAQTPVLVNSTTQSRLGTFEQPRLAISSLSGANSPPSLISILGRGDGYVEVDNDIASSPVRHQNFEDPFGECNSNSNAPFDLGNGSSLFWQAAEQHTAANIVLANVGAGAAHTGAVETEQHVDSTNARLMQHLGQSSDDTYATFEFTSEQLSNPFIKVLQDTAAAVEYALGSFGIHDVDALPFIAEEHDKGVLDCEGDNISDEEFVDVLWKLVVSRIASEFGIDAGVLESHMTVHFEYLTTDSIFNAQNGQLENENNTSMHNFEPANNTAVPNYEPGNNITVPNFGTPHYGM